MLMNENVFLCTAHTGKNLVLKILSSGLLILIVTTNLNVKLSQVMKA